MNKLFFTISLFLAFSYLCTAQISAHYQDSVQLKKLYKLSLTQGQSYNWLDFLSNKIGGRLSGSENAQKAVLYTHNELEKLDLDKVWLQPVIVPKWTRGAAEYAHIETGNIRKNLTICALGGSIATPAKGLKAEVVEVQGIEELEALGSEKLRGKIIFFNRPMQEELIQTFQAYGGCVDQRYQGAAEAAKYGAVGVIVRSVTHKIDDVPHTGSMTYNGLTGSQKIPAAAISTQDAESLSEILQQDPKAQLYYKLNCQNHKDVTSYNVIGEITGSEFPEEIIVVGGHLDSWDLGDGSHDDGAGVVQSMEVLRLLKNSGVKPKRTIRVVLFMNEENGLRGGNKYAEVAAEEGEHHIFALESDAGGFTPRGFSLDCNDAQFNRIKKWQTLFKPYLIHYFEKGGSGADINPLKSGDIVLAGLRPDSQRYFDYHHAATDTFDKVNKRELELGAATMASLVYLIDKYGTVEISTPTVFKN